MYKPFQKVHKWNRRHFFIGMTTGEGIIHIPIQTQVFTFAKFSLSVPVTASSGLYKFETWSTARCPWKVAITGFGTRWSLTSFSTPSHSIILWFYKISLSFCTADKHWDFVRQGSPKKLGSTSSTWCPGLVFSFRKTGGFVYPGGFSKPTSGSYLLPIWCSLSFTTLSLNTGVLKVTEAAIMT